MNLQSTFQIEHPVALVTGSGSARVGRVIAGTLAAAGCRLALHANTSIAAARQAADDLQRDHDVEVLVTRGDLADEAVPERLIDEAHSRFGRLDMLVNSAAIWHPTPIGDVTAAEVRRYFDINTLSCFLAARAAAAVMREQPRGGAIVNLGDWATGRPYLDHAAYFPSKGAVEVMTRSLAVEFARMNRRIRVNCVQPGPVLLGDEVPEAVRAQIATASLTGEIGSPEAIAHAVQFLCENDFVTGVCLPVDGGRMVYAPDGLQAGLNTG